MISTSFQPYEPLLIGWFVGARTNDDADVDIRFKTT
jgi:hypothetical protein